RVPQRLQNRGIALQRQSAELPDLVDGEVRIIPHVRLGAESAQRQEVSKRGNENADVIVIAAFHLDPVGLASGLHEQAEEKTVAVRDVLNLLRSDHTEVYLPVNGGKTGRWSIVGGAG